MPGCCVLALSPNCAVFLHSNPPPETKANKSSVMKGTHSVELSKTPLDCVKPVSKMVEI